MKFDDILTHLGEFGTYQRRIYFVLTIVAIPCALHTFSMVFLAAKTDYWCATPELKSKNCSELSDELLPLSACLALKKNISIPREEDPTSGKIRYSQCERYNLTGFDVAYFGSVLQSQLGESGDDEGEDVGYGEGEIGEANTLNQSTWESNGSLPVISCDAGWEFDTSQYTSTVNHQYQLVCENAGSAKYAQSAYFAGYMVGAFFLGMLADWFGRKPMFFLCLFASLLAGIAQAFAPTIVVFTIVRFFVAIFKMGLYMMAFVLCTELVGPSRRSFAGQFINIYYALGYMLLAPIAYLIRDWRMLQLALTMTFAPFFLLLPFVPESARWLISRGRYAEAEEIIKKAAKVNKVQLPEGILTALNSEEKQEDQVAVTGKYTYLDLLRTPNLRCRTFNLLLTWFVNNMVYYGIALSTSDLGVDHYIAAFVSGAVEIPAYLSSIFALQYVGRKLPLCIYLVVAGIACVSSSVFPPGAVKATIAMIGKFCITASFAVIYVYTAELYPTPIRSMGLCLCSMMARVSGILCPFILDLAVILPCLPYVIFGSFAICSGILVLCLPETRGQPLPETVEQAEDTRNDLCICLTKRRQGPRLDDVSMDDVAKEKQPYEVLPVEEPPIQDGGKDANDKV